jgi:hypothetical protein
MADWVDRLKRLLWSRQYAYRQVFKGEYAKIVLSDLADFCRANESTFDVNERKHVLAEGRREVILRIGQHLNLDADQLWALYSGGDDVAE